MNRKIRSLSILLTITAAIGIAGCGTKSSGSSTAQAVPDEGSADPSIAKAVTVYKSQCLVCHAADLGGKLGARSNLKGVGTKLTQEQIKAKILSGGNGMIAYKSRLKEDEIDALAAWLASKK